MTLAPPTLGGGTAWSPARVRGAIVVVSIVAGLLATINGPQPTGDPTVDLVLVALSVGAITWLGAAALRWDAALVALMAGVLSFSLIGLAVGVLAGVIGYLIKVEPGRRSILTAILIGIALNIAARSDLGLFLGASTIVGVTLALYISVVGFTRRTHATKRAIILVGGGLASIALTASFALAVSGMLAADDFREGYQFTEVGLDALGDGDIATARASFDAATNSFEAADHRVDTLLTAAARFVPVVAQHRRVATEMSAEAAESARLLSVELQNVDLTALSVTGGIDLDRVRGLQRPLLAVQLRIEAMQQAIDSLDSPWLLPPVSNRIHNLANEIAEQHQRGNDALSVALAAPALLGGDEPRTYFIGFTTPAEARGSGGFMGNWAEMTITNGQIAMTRFGRADDLNDAGDPTLRRFPTGDGNGFDQWLARYGTYNLSSGPDGTTGDEPWKNMNMSPDMATTGRAIANLYPQSGGGHLDGVFIMDVYTLARLLEFTGPIALPDGQLVDGQSVVTSDTAVKFLLKDQYDVTNVDTRVDALEDFSRTVVNTLLAGTFPPANDLLDTLGPMVDQGRFTGWAARPNEQSIMEQIGLSGTLQVPNGDDALAIVFNNAAGNKIDYYLGAAATYAVTADAATSTATGTLTVTLTNDAPDNGQPDYVIGNPVGLPVGTNRTLVSIFTRLPVTETLFDGVPIITKPGAEADYFVTSAFVTLPAGSTGTLTMEMAGTIDTLEGYTLLLRTPPTVGPTPITVDATWLDPDGAPHHASDVRDIPGATRLTVDATTPNPE